jgi:hypothetical protein
MYCYCIRNKTNDKKYIGISINSPSKRFNKHIWNSKNGSTLYFHNAINKYGPDNFELGWKDYTGLVTYKELQEIEIDMIAKYNTFNNGYNLTKGENGTRGWNTTPVSQYNLDLNLMETFDSIIEASEKTKICDASISSCCLHIVYTAGGFIWAYKGKDPRPYEDNVLIRKK